MRLSLSINRKTLQRWRWTLYPMLVVMLIGGSAVFVLFGGMSLWKKFVERRQGVNQQADVIQTYRQKLGVLKLLKRSELAEKIQEMGEAVPYSARIWETVNLAREAGNDTGAKLLEWKAFGGEVAEEPVTASGAAMTSANTSQIMTGVFDVTSAEQLQALLFNLERRLPLASVKRVMYALGRTQVDIEGKWSSFSRMAADVNLALPEGTVALVESNQKALSVYKRLPEFAVSSVSAGKNDPF